MKRRVKAYTYHKHSWITKHDKQNVISFLQINFLEKKVQMRLTIVAFQIVLFVTKYNKKWFLSYAKKLEKKYLHLPSIWSTMNFELMIESIIIYWDLV
jgi:hypothetical protein